MGDGGRHVPWYFGFSRPRQRCQGHVHSTIDSTILFFQATEPGKDAAAQSIAVLYLAGSNKVLG